MRDLMTLAWPVEQLGEAMETIARQRGLSPRQVEAPTPPVSLRTKSSAVLGAWVEAAAGYLGFEAEPVEVPYNEIEKLVRGGGPALLRLPAFHHLDHQGEPRFLALIGGNRRTVALLSPDLKIHRVRHEAVCEALRRPLEAPLEASVEQLLNQAGVAKRRQARARAALLREQLSYAHISGGWLLRLPPGASFWQQLKQARLLRSLFAPAGLYACQYVLTLLAWWVLGARAMNGQFDRGWLMAWALLLLTAVPFHLLATWMQGRFAIGAGGLLKQRLLCGALRLQPEEIRHQGAGQLLGQIIESSAIETLVLNGGFLALVAAIETVMAVAILSLGAGGWLHALMLCGWVALTLLVAWRYFRRQRTWTETRLQMTNDLVERMVGHRTRLAQEAREGWHDGEDQSVERYLATSSTMDRAMVRQAMMPRGWLVVGLLGLGSAFISGSGSPGALAISIGGTLLGFRALQKLMSSLSSLLSAAIAWRQVAHLFRAAARVEENGTGSVSDLLPDMTPKAAARSRSPYTNAPVLLEAHDLSFRYREIGEPVLRGCNVQIREGDRLLLEGASGGGKSTLASLLTGLRAPASGLLLLSGLDRQTLGARGWRQRVAAAPQFHENHVLTGTFAFNLLMGRQWPPSAEDMTEAETICRELGLGDLLNRMPAGLLQMVGETGWQLSHGERSRLFLARALLQGAEMVILDESFGALDPETLRRCLRCTLDRASTLLVIAHP